MSTAPRRTNSIMDRLADALRGQTPSSGNSTRSRASIQRAASEIGQILRGQRGNRSQDSAASETMPNLSAEDGEGLIVQFLDIYNNPNAPEITSRYSAEHIETVLTFLNDVVSVLFPC